MRVEWSNEALTDRAAIVDYLLPRNPHAAKRILLRLIDATTDLAMFPYMGREGEDDTREWVVVHPYVLLYEVNETAKIISVLRIWHTSQDRF
ncbi:plasmid stabilization protein [Acetobacter pasteurianus]|uniref:type II toxin-antitoxin system RelE/ParE family toxin n=1 Tax=Acetobacter pasteurianus TaxID=438 RepID=UPI000557FC54|nr:type II toxin-antitoxin system RelE/ParE family toxin [Acetobacter pasteurianus]RCL04207.1 plasmid stabilization protein [Acetobacter pasteurianus]RCL04397.1 plasmid stabilization protein [Acetobacter pasteurianus]GCD51185.1 plasmid stabilization system [Acetobacter pasteurianus subsp. pasteurianus LMG 1262 = NBRC 106471]